MKGLPVCSKPNHTEAHLSHKRESVELPAFKELTIYTDGAARGNPGAAGAGAVIYNRDGEIIKKIKAYLGTATNNVAEYMALILALKEAIQLQADSVLLFSDSELMVRQLKGIYRIKDKKLQLLAGQVHRLLSHFIKHDIMSIERSQNRVADSLANLAIDEQELRKAARGG